jgi:hypothetical protein
MAVNPPHNLPEHTRFPYSMASSGVTAGTGGAIDL